MKASPDARWDEFLALIRKNVTNEVYETWFKPIVFGRFDEAKRALIIQVPTQFFYEYLEEKFVDLMSTVLQRCFGNGVSLFYKVLVDKEHNITQRIESDAPTTITGQHPRSNANQSPSVLDAAAPQQIDPQLNPHLTFNNFIEGDSNKLPRSVGLSIAEHPNTTQFNPMFIFGPSGCGKTHLINAIGVRTKQLYPPKRVLYISARLFQVQYTNAVLNNKTNDFIAFYQTIDMLIVDDIQEWVNSPSTQNTFFHIFNHLFRNGKRIILASDRPPVDLQEMPERLLTRFCCGLIAELEKPNTQLCIDILNSKIHRDGLDIPEEVIRYIAGTACGSVRDLEGVINSLMAFSIVYNSKIDMKLAERVIKRAVKIDDKPLTVDEIMEKVCRHYNVTVAQVNSRSRKKDFVTARQVSMYLVQKYTKMPASRIGRMVGNRDHSTVIHSCSQVELKLKTDKSFVQDLAAIEQGFNIKQNKTAATV